jgi:hypothetical protein
MDFWTHVPDHISQRDNLTYASSELPDTVMKYSKPAYQQLNHHDTTIHIVRLPTIGEVIQDWEMDAKTVKQHLKDILPQMTVLIKLMIYYLSPEIKTLDNLAQQCAMPKAELQNHIALSFLQFANFTDYVNHDQHFSCHNDA